MGADKSDLEGAETLKFPPYYLKRVLTVRACQANCLLSGLGRNVRAWRLQGLKLKSESTSFAIFY